MPSFKKYFFSWFECGAWISGLLGLALVNPAAETHFNLCLFKWIGFSFCPGCGLGHAVSWLFHGDIQRSLQAHPLGILALIILLYRIFTLTRINLITHKT